MKHATVDHLSEVPGGNLLIALVKSAISSFVQSELSFYFLANSSASFAFLAASSLCCSAVLVIFSTISKNFGTTVSTESLSGIAPNLS